MSWTSWFARPWRRRRTRDALERAREAAEAKRRAEAELRRVRGQWPEVHRASRKLDALGAEIERSMRRGDRRAT